jgi:FtsH-binding integral membrane protein
MEISHSYGSTSYSMARANEFIRHVYNWMILGLAITGLLSMFTTANSTIIATIAGNPILFFGLIIAEFGLVVAISAAINRLRSSTAFLMFLTYSALNGLTMAVIFLAYTQASIATTFFITAATFAAMSVYGYSTKRDLTSWGSFLFMGLIGVIVASIVNIFLHSQMIYWIITYCGILVFVGLTAYDNQKLKEMAAHGFDNEETEKKSAIIGALRLYLDFINLFLLFLRLFGRRR